MIRIFILSGLLCLFSPFTAYPTIINIPADYLTIQQGIDASSDGDTVLVQPGTYVENINFNGHNIVLGSLFLTTGDTSYIEQTVIDGDSSGSVLFFESGEDSNAVIYGFTVQNGLATRGGGIYCRNNSDPTIIFNNITENTADFGGGICCRDSSNSIISNNSIIENNGEFGGGIYCLESSPLINNNLIIGNTGNLLGGGMYCINNGDPYIINNTLSKNFALNLGGGVYCSNSSPSIVNTIFWADSAGMGDHEVSGTPIITYSDIEGGWPGEGNIDTDPFFRDPINGDFHLKSVACGDNADSPCIDAGDLNLIDSLLDCLWGLGIDLCDMGAYGGGDSVTIENRIINVPGEYPTIQLAIDASNHGDTVLVQPGTYLENVNFNGHNIVLGSLFMMTGDTSYITNTVIDGDSSGSVVTFENGEAGTTIITGFTIQNGWGGPNSNSDGGGITCKANSGPVIINNILIGNNTRGYGGGIQCQESSPNIINNVINDNTAHSGGGIRCDSCNATIIRNKIINNSAIGEGGDGGGIDFYDRSDVNVINNEIIGNFASWGGGISLIDVEGSIIKINNNIISDNTCLYEGGGIYLMFAFSSIIGNNTIAENIAGEYGGGIRYTPVYPPTLINTILWDNIAGIEGNGIYINGASPHIYYCDLQDTLWPGAGNISVNPFFSDPYSEDFHLMSIACGDSADSPCIDAGDPNILDSLLDCAWGLGALRSDMGAYGGGDSLITSIFYDHIPPPDRFMMLQNYPNPFNAQTTIRFALLNSQNVELTIYDLLGRQVQTLIDNYMQDGAHTVTFDGSNLSSGVYFYRLQSGEVVETKRMVLLK